MSSSKEEKQLKNYGLVDRAKHLVEQFDSVSDKKEEDLDEAKDNSALHGDCVPIAKPNCDGKKVQKHADKFNKSIERSKKSLNQFIDMCQCSNDNHLADKAEFGSSIVGNFESGSASDEYKVKPLFKRRTKKEEKIKNTSSIRKLSTTKIVSSVVRN